MTAERALKRPPPTCDNVNEQSVNDPTTAERELHRLRNELYSASLTFRAIATLLERGEVDRAREAAMKTLQQLTSDD